jgi:DNA phosphorothioation-dependent restriction protein DptG
MISSKMEKQLFIFNARRGAVEKDTESIMCEPFFSSRLKHGQVLVLEQDFIILNEIAISVRPVKSEIRKKGELIDWLADQIGEFKKEETPSEESKQSACEIIEHILRMQ